MTEAAARQPDGKLNLPELDLPGLENWFVAELGQKPYHARQVWQWMWQRLAQNFSEMTNLSLKLRRQLEEIAVIAWPELLSCQTSKDGTRKLLLRLADGALIESALIPAEGRNGEIRWAQCLSTQAGCPMACAFCATGRTGFRRSLTRAEILGQVVIGRRQLRDFRPAWPVLRNLVFMGMGEPLLNLENLLPALRCLQSDIGLGFSPRRITVSTCGIKKGIAQLGESGLAFLAVSLHAPNQQLREQIMPRAARWPLAEMLAELAHYPLKTRERITFEYLLLGGVNDQPEHARELARILAPIKAKLNLIVYNPSPGLPFKVPEPEAVARFQQILCDKNMTAIVRKSRGGDIAAACGQLAACAAEPFAAMADAHA